MTALHPVIAQHLISSVFGTPKSARRRPTILDPVLSSGSGVEIAYGIDPSLIPSPEDLATLPTYNSE